MFQTVTIEGTRGQIQYVDYNNLTTDSGKPGLSIFTKFVELGKNLSEINEEREFLEEVNKYVKINEDLEFTNNSQKNLTILLLAGNVVMVEGKRGPAHHVLVGRKSFEKILDQEERDSLQRAYKVWFAKDENLDYVLVWREGDKDEPGCILVKNEEKYNFVSTGLHPEHQFVKIAI